MTSSWMIGLFLLTTYPGLYEVLGNGPGHDAERLEGQITLEWTNGWLLMPALALILPPFARSAPVGSALASGALFFTGVTTFLQHMQWADGQPYPFSLHYFELIDPLLAVVAAWCLATALQLRSGRAWRMAVFAGGALLLISQAWLALQGQDYVWLNRFWLWATLWPFG